MRPLPVLAAALLVGGCGGAEERALPPGNQATITAPPATSDETTNIMVPERVARPPSPVPANPAPPPASRPPPLRSADRYRAIGTEPFWAVTVRGAVATLDRPDKAPIHIAISRYDDRMAIRYLGAGFTMTATPGPCGDGMSDTVWSDRVAIAFGEGTLNGCGGVPDDGP